MRRWLVATAMLTAMTTGSLGETDAHLTVAVKSAIVRNKLVTHPECLDFLFTRNINPGLDQVEVLEHHDLACGGDPQVEHRLFEVLVDQKTHRMTSDAADPINGTMKVLR